MTIGIGWLLMLVSFIWFVVLSFQIGSSTGQKVLWAIVNLFQPIGGIIFFFVKKAGLIPMILAIIGAVFFGYGWITSVGEMF